FFFSSRRRHTRWPRDWSSDVCSSDLNTAPFHSRASGLFGRNLDEVGLAKFEQHQLVARASSQRYFGGINKRTSSPVVFIRGNDEFLSRLPIRNSKGSRAAYLAGQAFDDRVLWQGKLRSQ